MKILIPSCIRLVFIVVDVMNLHHSFFSNILAGLNIPKVFIVAAFGPIAGLETKPGALWGER